MYDSDSHAMMRSSFNQNSFLYELFISTWLFLVVGSTAIDLLEIKDLLEDSLEVSAASISRKRSRGMHYSLATVFIQNKNCLQSLLSD